jgi:hypothetical protein
MTMKLRRRHVLSLLGAIAFAGPSEGAEAVSDQAVAVFKVIDALDVEHKWPAGLHVDWLTGVPDGKPEKSEGKHTHCSAFVAVAAKALGIYLLRPPEHGQVLLANAQYDWLLSQGGDDGWKQLQSSADAQDAANQGMLVVAVYHNHSDQKPGHIAIVRPGDKSPDLLAAEGPDETQAGEINYRIVSLKKGFAGHPGAFKNNEILFFAHAVDPAALQ